MTQEKQEEMTTPKEREEHKPLSVLAELWTAQRKEQIVYSNLHDEMQKLALLKDCVGDISWLLSAVKELAERVERLQAIISENSNQEKND